MREVVRLLHGRVALGDAIGEGGRLGRLLVQDRRDAWLGLGAGAGFGW